MSEFHVAVTRLEKINKHPNADMLEITEVYGGYPCIIKAGTFNEGDLATYIPVDALVPANDKRFSFLGSSQSVKVIDSKEFFRIKAIKLRGVFSMGLLVAPERDWIDGQNVQAELGIEKYEPPIVFQGHNVNNQPTKEQHWMQCYTDIEGLRKHKNILEAGEEVVLNEKLHGSSSRFVYRDNELRVGSHYVFKHRHTENMWWRVAIEHKLEEKLGSQYQDIGLYGEVLGLVQDLRYGATQNNPLMLRIFDVIDTKTNRYWDYDDMKSLCELLALPTVPEIYRGPWLGYDEMICYADGQSLIHNANHMREGFVVRSVKERYEHKRSEERRVGK